MSMRLLNTEEGECDDRPIPTFSPCCLDDAWSYLYRAVRLWQLVDPARGDDLRRLLQEEVEHDRSSGPIIVTPALAARIVANLAALPDALLSITDQYYRLRPDKVAEVLEKASRLVDSWQEPSGTVYTLANDLHDVYRARKFLARAVELGRDIEVE
jgi:hypothetical protein